MVVALPGQLGNLQAAHGYRSGRDSGQTVLGFVRAHPQVVQARLGDAVQGLRSSRGLDPINSLLVLGQRAPEGLFLSLSKSLQQAVTALNLNEFLIREIRVQGFGVLQRPR